MSEQLESLLQMGLPAAVLHALVPRSASLAAAQAPPPPKRVDDVDRFTHGATVEPEPVITELRSLAERHQARQAARLPDAA
jgi:hypothetical protein